MDKQEVSARMHSVFTAGCVVIQNLVQTRDPALHTGLSCFVHKSSQKWAVLFVRP